jgi:dTMP kinase
MGNVEKRVDRPVLIAFEGLDQSGKETQARYLRARLEQDGHHVRALSFPEYETPIGREIAQALKGDREFGPEVMQLLYVANRCEFKTRLESWLGAGDIVICDRYRASSVAYGEAQGLDPDWLLLIQRYLPAALMTVLLDIAPETAVARKAAGRDRYERDLDLLRRVRESYRRQAADPGWVLIDGERPPDDVTAAVEQAVLPRLALR